jgi:serine protease Do
LGSDPSTDLALLQIREKGLPYLPLASSDDVEVGEWVLAMGNPFNLNSTVTAGIISAKARNINILRDRSAIESFIQTDAAINPGKQRRSPGQPPGRSDRHQYGHCQYHRLCMRDMALPSHSNIVSKVIEDLMEYGMVQRGYLGLMIRSVDENLASEKDLEVTEGVYVDSINVNSAAGKQEFRWAMSLSGRRHRHPYSGELLETIGRKRPGDEVTPESGQFRQGIDIQSSSQEPGRRGKISPKSKGSVLETLGVELEEVDSQTASDLGIDGGLKVTRLGPGKLRDPYRYPERLHHYQGGWKENGKCGGLCQLPGKRLKAALCWKGSMRTIPGPIIMLSGFDERIYQSSSHAKTRGAAMVASDSMMYLGVSTSSFPQVIFSLGTAPE